MDRVREFHEVFGCHIEPKPRMLDTHTAASQLLLNVKLDLEANAKQLKLEAARSNKAGRTEEGLVIVRAQLMVEELAEVIHEMATGFNPARLLAELTDLDYVVKGTFLSYGLQDYREAAADEIHRANMSKLEDGKPIIDDSGRVVKSKDFRPADIQSVLSGG